MGGRGWWGVLVLAVALVLGAMAGRAGAAEAAGDGGALVLRRVLLSTGGVGYFEYEARVDGAAELALNVRRDRVDDVLKSIVVYDDQGGVGTISLPGREPLREAFREMPFPVESLKSPVDLLNALRGAEVRLQGASGVVGRLLSVTPETVQLSDHQGTLVRHRIALMAADGLRQAVLEDVESLRFTDARLQEQVGRALAAVARNGEKDQRRLAIHTTGTGVRTIRVAYVAEVPLWKTAYRLTLDTRGDIQGDAPKQGDLQGWAVVENLTGEDWKAVELTVVSGNPVTFRQALYDAYYVNRPLVPVEILGRVLPRADSGPESGAWTSPASSMAKSMDSASPAPPPPMAMAPGSAGGGGVRTRAAFPAMEAAAPTPRAAEVAAAEGSEATTQVMFRHPQPVTVESGHSLLLPIVARPVPAERLALYQPGTHPRHPLATVRLRNDGATGLPPGILTLYERGSDGTVAYVGDARLGMLPVGEDRLLSFAVDQKLTVDRQDRGAEILSRATLADGVLHVVTMERAVTTYAISGPARESRAVVIEHARRPGWDLVQPALDKAEQTPGWYRLGLALAAAGRTLLEVVLERPREERYEITELEPDRIQAFAAAATLSPDIRRVFVRLGELRSVMAERQQVVDRLENEQASLSRDQDRMRENLKVVDRTSDLYRRYLAKFNDQETKMEKLEHALEAARAAAEQAEKALADYARGIKL